MKKRLPKMNCKVGKNLDDFELGIYRDKIGNITFLLWKQGVGFRDSDFRVNVSPYDVKKIRDYLNKIIDYVERE